MKNNLNYNKLIQAGCKHTGNILIPPTDKIVPVDINRLKGWSTDRVNKYIKDIENESIKI